MDACEKKNLWIAYSKTKSSDIKNELIIEYAQLVKYVAGRLSIYFGGNVEYDDLVGYGIFGLIDAIEKFDIKKGIKFETYASLRIRGAILDSIRKMDWIPRSIRKKQKLIDAANNKLENQNKNIVKDEDIARELNISIEEYYKWVEQTSLLNIASFEEIVEQNTDVINNKFNKSGFEKPEDAIEKAEIKQYLIDAISKLTEKEKKVITLYYYEELTLKEISHIMEVSESRVSQLHTKSLKKMRTTLGKYGEVLTIF